MASEVISFPVNLRRNQNKYNAAYGKYYPEADTKEPLNLKGFAKHLSEHGKLEMTGDRYLSAISAKLYLTGTCSLSGSFG